MTATVFGDFKGVFLVDFLHARRNRHCGLLEKVRAAYRSNRLGFPIRDVLLLHDNARPHSATITQEKLAQMYWTALEHPPYSPVLSPSDYHVWAPYGGAGGGGQRFDDDELVENFVRQMATDASSFIL